VKRNAFTGSNGGCNGENVREALEKVSHLRFTLAQICIIRHAVASAAVPMLGLLIALADAVPDREPQPMRRRRVPYRGA